MCDDSIIFEKGMRCSNCYVHFYVFHVRALRDAYTCKPTMHTDKIRIIVYSYLRTSFGRFCYHHLGALQAY